MIKHLFADPVSVQGCRTKSFGSAGSVANQPYRFIRQRSQHRGALCPVSPKSKAILIISFRAQIAKYANIETQILILKFLEILTSLM